MSIFVLTCHITSLLLYLDILSNVMIIIPFIKHREQQPFNGLFGGQALNMRPRRFSASFSQVPGSPVSLNALRNFKIFL